MLVAIGAAAAGLVREADTIKQESKAAIAAMHGLGIHVLMVTGDNERSARHVAAQVGLEEILAGVLPEGEVEAIRDLQHKHGQHAASDRPRMAASAKCRERAAAPVTVGFPPSTSVMLQLRRIFTHAQRTSARSRIAAVGAAGG
ncbi:MAG: HAD family hydrolase [Alkalilacustris sp.]